MPETNQPDWRCVANLGDADPINHGGYFVYVDATGHYPPEAELVEPDDSGRRWTVRRFPLEPCTFVGGVLSDNPYHPDCAAWFADDMDGMASTFGVAVETLVAWFTSDDPLARAEAWRTVGEFHGYVNLDEYPLTFTDRAEVEARYRWWFGA